MKKKNNIFIQRSGGTLMYWFIIIFNVVIGLFLTPYMINTVGDRQYGIYSLGVSMLNWLTLFTLAMGSGYSHFLTMERKKDGDIGERRAINSYFKIYSLTACLIATIGLVVTIFIFTGIIPLTQYTSNERIVLCIIMAFSLINTTINTILMVYKSYYFYKEKYFLIYLIEFSFLPIQAVLSFLILHLGCGIQFVVLAHLGATMLASFAQAFIGKFYLKEKVLYINKTVEEKEKQKNLMKIIFFFSIFVILNTAADELNRHIDVIILGFINADSVGSYNIVTLLNSYLINFVSILSGIFVQGVNKAYSDENSPYKVNTLFKRSNFLQLLFAFLLIGGFASCGQDFLTAWVGVYYAPMYYVCLCIFIINSFGIGRNLSNHCRRVKHVHIKVSLIYTFVIVANIGFSLLFCYLLPGSYCVWGCVIGTLISTGTGYWVLMPIYDHKYTKLPTKSYFIFYLILFVISAISFGLTYLIYYFIPMNLNVWLIFIIKAVTFVIFYIILASLLVRYSPLYKMLGFEKKENIINTIKKIILSE